MPKFVEVSHSLRGSETVVFMHLKDNLFLCVYNNDDYPNPCDKHWNVGVVERFEESEYSVLNNEDFSVEDIYQLDHSLITYLLN